MTNKILNIAATTIALVLAGCAGKGGDASREGGELQQAGSSTVYPIAEAWAEDLAQEGLQVTVGGGGSGSGASKLCAGEIDIGDLSRKMKASEIEQCRANGVEPVEWTVAFDGLTVVVSRENAFVDRLSVDELQRIWAANSTVRTWADVREGWPAQEIRLYGADSDSGTYEYFNEEVLGKRCGNDGEQMCSPRSDYNYAADDNVLVEGVRGNAFALGYFGFAYYHENAEALRAVPIVAHGANDPVTPSFETIRDGSYKPFSRPLYMYTNGVPAEGSPLRVYLEHAYGAGQEVVREVGYVELDAATLAAMRAQLGA